MYQPSRNLAQIERDLCSADQGLRVRVSWELLDWSRKDAGVRAKALPIFQNVVEQRLDAPTVNNAIRGIGEIACPDAAWTIRLSLFDDPRDDFVRGVVMAIDDSRYVQPLLGLLAKRSDDAVQMTLIRTLGRLKDPAAFDAIVSFLSHPTLTADTIEALGDLGDPRAIPYVKPFLSDRRTTWEIDNHGPMQLICDHAERALAQLGKPPTVSNAVRAAGAVLPMVGILPGAAAAAPPGWMRLFCYVPVVAAALEIPWCILMIMSQMGYKPNGFSREAQRAVTAACALPAAIGLAVGLYAFASHVATSRVEWWFLSIGCAVCALIVICFVLAILR